ncbi:hypothetical protein KKH43_06175 [Patescibacteria group bacterium]|nr:hypothetical protein [Patescibacteria group bacterium]
MSDFSDPIKQMTGEIEDVQVDIDRKERELLTLTQEVASLSKRQELLEDELEKMYKEKTGLEQKRRTLEYEL